MSTMAKTVETWDMSPQVRIGVLVVALGLGIYLCYQMVLPFVSALTGAVALAVVFAPMQAWLESKCRYPGLAAAISVLLIGLIVFVPAGLVVQKLVIEATHGAQLLQHKVDSGDWRRAIEAQPRFAPMLILIETELDLPGTIRSVASWLSNLARTIVGISFVQLIALCLTFYLLFFFLRDRLSILQVVRRLSPLSGQEMDHLFARVSETIHAMVRGSLMVAAAQGFLGGLMFWWLGMPVPLLWGVVMTILAIVPMLGAYVVWVPAALYLILEGQWEKALILSLWGVFVVGLVDNLLRPFLVGNRLHLHTVLVFVAVVGGLMWFGPAGLILGPVTLTVTMTLFEIWTKRSLADTPMVVKAAELSRLENEGGPSAPEPE